MTTLNTFLAQGCGAGLHHVARNLRHLRGGRAGAGRVGEDVQIVDSAFVDTRERVGEHLLRLGRKARDQVGAERHFGAGLAQAAAQVDRVGARVAALHALQDHVVARLEAEVHVRCNAWLVRQCFKQGFVDLDRIDGRQAKLFQVRHKLEDARHQISKLWRVRQISAPRG